MNTYILPAYWASALINNDFSGLQANEEKELRTWLNNVKPGNCISVSEEPFFANNNDANSLAGDVNEYSFFKNQSFMKHPTIIYLLNGGSFSYKSTHKKGRILTIKAIVRERPMCDLFIVKANDLKHHCGVFNEASILPIIKNAIDNKPQEIFRIK